MGGVDQFEVVGPCPSSIRYSPTQSARNESKITSDRTQIVRCHPGIDAPVLLALTKSSTPIIADNREEMTTNPKATWKTADVIP
jgi:hypothetical protein